MGLRDKYNAAILAAKGIMEGSAEEREGKLFFRGTVKTDDEKNRIWNAIKTVPDWSKDIVADIQVLPANVPAKEPAHAVETYTVKRGDTLSKIAKAMLGDANSYMKIFEANRDVLTDPNAIEPGQVLKIPAAPVAK